MVTMNTLNNNITVDHYLDTQGLKCPEPIMLLHRAIRKAEAKQVIEMVATDPTTLNDVDNFCNNLGHRLLDTQTVSSDTAPVYYYWIEKKS